MDDYLQKLKELMQSAGNNIDASGNMVYKQADLAGKKLDNPDYVPTEDEQQNENNYYNAVNNAMIGSVTPTKKDQAIKDLIERYSNGLREPEQNLLEIAKEQQIKNRNLDFAERFKKALQERKFKAIKDALKRNE